MASKDITTKMYKLLVKSIEMLGVSAEYRTKDANGKPEVYYIKCAFTKASTQEVEIVNAFGVYTKIITIAYNLDFEPTRFDSIIVDGAKYTVVSSVRMTAPGGIIGYKCYCNGEGT